MELWIRSQDREILITAQHLDIYNSSVEGEECYVIEESGTDLGCYETYERALEVLNEIEERIMLINTINIAKDRDSLIACKNALTEEKIKGLGYPYQMPKK